MRPFLRWTFGATAVASAAALWVDDKAANVVAAVARAPSAAPASAAVVAEQQVAALPSELEPIALDPARRDIFAPVQPPAPPPPPPPKPFVGPPLPPLPPAPPPVNWRYLGSMTTPAGERLVMLARGDNSALVQSGTQLDDGFVVQAVGAEVVRLAHPPSGIVVDLPVLPTSSSR